MLTDSPAFIGVPNNCMARLNDTLWCVTIICMNCALIASAG